MLATAPRMAASSVTLATKPVTSAPLLRSSFTAPSIRPPSMSMIATHALARAKAMADANPMPDAPPVTTAHLPFKLPGIISTYRYAAA